MGFNQQYDLSQKQQLSPLLLQRIQLLNFNQDELITFLNSKMLDNPFLEIKIPDSKLQSIGAGQDMSWIADTKRSLRDYLIEQVLLTYRDTLIREMMFWWINQLDQRGYCLKTLDEAANDTKADKTLLLDALVLLQQLEPAGIAARSLQECLMLQTERDQTAPETAYIILEESFNDLIDRKWKEIAKRYDITLPEIQRVFDYIKKLNPSPGDDFSNPLDYAIRPDLIVQLSGKELTIREAKQNTPILQFDQGYASELKETGNKEVLNYVKDKQKEYKSLQENLQQRQETILRVGTAIIQKQKAFFFGKSHALVSLQLKELAEELDLHESTISRTINGKYIQTDFGTYEFKYFLSRNHQIDDDTSFSTHSVQQHLLKLIENENKQKPLSDQKIVELLKKESFDLSRRTVTKYRKQLNIPASSKRKRYDE